MTSVCATCGNHFPDPRPDVYGGWWTPVLRSDARETVRRSAARYIEHLRGTAAG